MLLVASADTAYNADTYRPGTLTGHCGAVSAYVLAKYGGTLLRARVNNEPHLFNRLPDGTIVDLTSCQYGGNGIDPITTGNHQPPRRTVNPRFTLFAARIDAHH